MLSWHSRMLVDHLCVMLLPGKWQSYTWYNLSNKSSYQRRDKDFSDFWGSQGLWGGSAGDIDSMVDDMYPDSENGAPFNWKAYGKSSGRIRADGELVFVKAGAVGLADYILYWKRSWKILEGSSPVSDNLVSFGLPWKHLVLCIFLFLPTEAR